jgi:hypothetical protein
MGTEFDILKMYLDKVSEKFKMSSMPIFTKAMETATKYVRMFTDYLVDHSKFVEGVFIAIGAAITYFMLPAAISGASAIWLMIAPFVAVGAAAAAVGLVFALLYDDIMNFIEGGDSMIGEVVKKWPIIGEILKGLGAQFVFFWDVAKAVFNFLVGMFDDPAAAFEKFKSDIGAGVDTLINTFPGLKDMIATITDAFSAAGNTITGVWDAIVAAITAAIAVVMNGINAVVSAFNKAKAFIGFGDDEKSSKSTSAPETRKAAVAPATLPPETRKAAVAGQEQIAVAASAPMSSQTSSSISNSKSSRSTSVNVGKVEVKTQATDAAGISKAIGGSMETQMRQAANNFDDGLLA